VSAPDKWICGDCGYDGFRLSVTHATVDVAVALGCPVCSGEMFRDDPLGRIEMEAKP
jgi:hypothetical protein